MKLLITLLCKGTCIPVAPLSKGRVAVPPECTHVPASHAAWDLKNETYKSVKKTPAGRCSEITSVSFVMKQAYGRRKDKLFQTTEQAIGVIIVGNAEALDTKLDYLYHD